MWSRLSALEGEIVESIARGMRNRTIARGIGRSEKTVERLVTSLYDRFELDRDCERRVLLARLFLLRTGAVAGTVPAPPAPDSEATRLAAHA